jgi:hypothetical protein
VASPSRFAPLFPKPTEEIRGMAKKEGTVSPFTKAIREAPLAKIFAFLSSAFRFLSSITKQRPHNATTVQASWMLIFICLQILFLLSSSNAIDLSNSPASSSSFTHLPIINISALIHNTPERSAIIRQIGNSCRQIGFFYISDHEIDQNLQMVSPFASRILPTLR